jgi:hypothetical protein
MPAPPADPAEKIERAGWPPGAAAEVVEARPGQMRVRVDAPADFVLTVRVFAFPGWRADVDGSPAAITASAPHGLITVPVPAGEHTVTLRLADTPARTAGWIVSALALLSLAAGLVWPRRVQPALAGPAVGWDIKPIGPVLAGLGLLLAARWAADCFQPAIVEPPAALARLEGHLALLSFQLAPDTARAGETLPLTLEWQATGPVPGDFSVFVHVLAPDGQLWGQSDKVSPLAEFPTGRWPAGRRMTDGHQLALKPDIRAGSYALRVGLWDRLSGVRLRVLGPDGQPTDQDGVTLPVELRVQP